MKLLTFKTLWGCADTDRIDTLENACITAAAAGFDGIEGQIPARPEVVENFAEKLDNLGLRYLAEICTAGSYVPNRTASLSEHLRDLDAQLTRLGPLRPERVNCIGGCDRWDVGASCEFFLRGLELADKHDVVISFETHRGRSLYSPWQTEKILDRMDLPLTCDFSHWCVVCEGLGESEDDLIRRVAEHARHIHGRVGYDQGPQVPTPRNSRYREDLDRHLNWWRWIWQAQRARGEEVSTLTPEFGPDGYQQIDAASDRPVGNLDAINQWLAQLCHDEFRKMGDQRRETREGLVPSPISPSNISPIP